MITVGVLGAGQLGRMLALAGYPLGLRLRFFDVAADATAGRLADIVVGTWDDPDALCRFARDLDVVTYEFENVPVSTARILASGPFEDSRATGGNVPVYPPLEALEHAQDRLVEKRLFHALGIPTPKFIAVDDEAGLRSALAALGTPAILKTRRLGYDGRGQCLIRSTADVAAATRLVGAPCILEEYVAFSRELSILAVRGRDGTSAFYPLVENEHRGGILHLSLAPAQNVPSAMNDAARVHAQRLLEALQYVGVLAIEFFEVNGRLLANEFAPRVHNTGHWTIEGAATSQFENHLRAILGWPLGDTSAIGHSAMLNLIGVPPVCEAILACDGAHLHLYDKSPAPGRKLGHVTVCGNSEEARNRRLERVRSFRT